jgi:hypothetical protein
MCYLQFISSLKENKDEHEKYKIPSKTKRFSYWYNILHFVPKNLFPLINLVMLAKLC